MKYKWMKPTRKIHKHIVNTAHGDLEVGYPVIYFCRFGNKGEVLEYGYVDEIYNQLGGNVVILDGFDSGIRNVFKVMPHYWKHCRFYSSFYDMMQHAA